MRQHEGQPERGPERQVAGASLRAGLPGHRPGAPAAATGSMSAASIGALQRLAGNAAVAERLAAPPRAGVAPVAVQRAVGFELQSTWTIDAIGGVPPDSKDVAYQGTWFVAEVDKGDGKPELEIVTSPLATWADVQAAKAEIREFVATITDAAARRSQNGRFTQSGGGWQGQVRITGTMNAGPSFRMQYTEGVTPGDIPALFSQLHPSGEAVAAATAGVQDPGARGLATAVTAYIGDALHYVPTEKLSPKYAFPLMARTDFHSTYLALGATDQAAFDELADGDDFLGHAWNAKLFAGTGPTVRQWVTSIQAGRKRGAATEPKDLLSPPAGFDSHAAVDKWNARHPGDPRMKYAMGMYGVVGGRVLFEARSVGASSGQKIDAALARLDELVTKAAARDPALAPPREAPQDKRKRDATDEEPRRQLRSRK